MKRRNFLKILGVGLAYACTPVIFIKEKATGWLGVTDGSFSITVDGNSIDFGPLDFSGLYTDNPVDKIIINNERKLVWKPGDFGHFEFERETNET